MVRSRHVRFTPDSGHSSLQVECPKSAISGRSGDYQLDCVWLSNGAVEGLSVTGHAGGAATPRWVPEPPGNACECIELRSIACFWEQEQENNINRSSPIAAKSIAWRRRAGAF
jgi:hypothetical protein